MNFNGKEISGEVLAKAMACQTAEELLALAKAEGIELTRDEAEAYLAEMADFELDEATLKQAAGGDCWNEKCAEYTRPKRHSRHH